MSDEEIKVQLTAEFAQLQAGMEAGAASVQKATAQMQVTVAEEAAAFNAAVQAKIDAMARLNVAFAGNLASAEGVTEAEAALDQAMAAGAISAAEQTAYLQRLTAAEVESTIATEASTAAFTMSGQVAREVGVMIGEVARGNYTRLEGSTITLANRTGLLSTALNAVLSPLGLAAIAAAALGYEIFEAGQQFNAMEGAVLATGDAAGYTAGQLMGMAQDIGQSSGNIGLATEAVQKLAESGRFAGEDLHLVAQAATDMAALTGQSIQATVSQIEKLREDPVKAVAKLNEQYHFLTLAQFKEIEAAQQAGDSMKAASIAYEAMADKMQGRTDQLNEHANVLIRSWRELKQVWGESMTEANHALGGGDSSNALNEANLLLGALEKQKQQAQEMGSSTLPGITLQITAQQKKVAGLTSQFASQAQAAASVGQAAQKSAEQISAMAKEHKPKGASANHDDHDAAQADRDAFNEQRLNHSMSLTEEKDYWQQKKEAATAGTQEYRQAVQQLLEIKNKEATGGREAARREVEDARRSAEVRISTEREAQAELQAEAKKQQALSLEKLKASHDEAVGEIANKRQQYQNEYSEGTISAQKLLQLEQALVAQKLAVDLKYLEDKKKLDAGNALTVVKDNAAIVAAQQSAHSQMLASEKQYLKNSEKEWKNHAKKIEGAMQGAINSMLFQHQTLRQGVANIAMVIGEDFIQQAVMKPLDKWIMGEAQKVAASFSTQTTLQAQRAADSAAEAVRGAASVVRAAGVAGAMGTASFAGAPWPVDMGAPAFGAGMAAAAASYAPMASAAGGWERVPFDGAITELHRDEMVLPKHIADPMRQMAMGGGQGGGQNVTIQAMDQRSFKDWSRRNMRDFADTLKLAHRRGHFGNR